MTSELWIPDSAREPSPMTRLVAYFDTGVLRTDEAAGIASGIILGLQIAIDHPEWAGAALLGEATTTEVVAWDRGQLERLSAVIVEHVPMVATTDPEVAP